MEIFTAENMLKNSNNFDEIFEQRDLTNIFAEEEKNLLNVPN
jgi:hypothetical protein